MSDLLGIVLILGFVASNVVWGITFVRYNKDRAKELDLFAERIQRPEFRPVPLEDNILLPEDGIDDSPEYAAIGTINPNGVSETD